MNNTLARVLIVVAVLAAAIAVTTLVLKSLKSERRSEPAPAREQVPEDVRVLIASDGPRHYLLKRRFAENGRAQFTDQALLRALGAEPASMQFVELWITNSGEDMPAPNAAPSVRIDSGNTGNLIALASLVRGAPSDAARAWIAALSPSGEVIRKDSMRRVVYALSAELPFERIESASLGDVTFLPAKSTPDRLEAFVTAPDSRLSEVVIKPDSRAGRMSALAGEERK